MSRCPPSPCSSSMPATCAARSTTSRSRAPARGRWRCATKRTASACVTIPSTTACCASPAPGWPADSAEAQLGAPDARNGDVGQPHHLAGGLDGREAVEHLLEDHPHLQARQRGAEAEVTTEAERELRVRGAPDVEGVGGGAEHRFV